jgi:hypothetical protein
LERSREGQQLLLSVTPQVCFRRTLCHLIGAARELLHWELLHIEIDQALTRPVPPIERGARRSRGGGAEGCGDLPQTHAMRLTKVVEHNVVCLSGIASAHHFGVVRESEVQKGAGRMRSETSLEVQLRVGPLQT